MLIFLAFIIKYGEFQTRPVFEVKLFKGTLTLKRE